jgi:hypothetical protein
MKVEVCAIFVDKKTSNSFKNSRFCTVIEITQILNFSIVLACLSITQDFLYE